MRRSALSVERLAIWIGRVQMIPLLHRPMKT